MRSFNNQFIEFNDTVIARYIKTPISAVSGWRSDPHRPENRIDWLLATPVDATEVRTNIYGRAEAVKLRTEYDAEVIEIYSETEHTKFKQWNKRLIAEGILVPFTGALPELETANSVTDETVDRIAKVKTITQFRAEISEFTSRHTVQRILDAAIVADRPISFIEAAKARLNDLV